MPRATRPNVEPLERRALLAGTPDFLTTFGSPDTTHGEAGTAVATDYSGNAYVAGTFFGTVDFDPRRNHAFALTSAGQFASDTPRNDAFVAKYSPAGVLIWARQLTVTGTGSTVDGSVGGIAVDRAGAVYLTGLFDGTTDFNPRRGTFALTAETNHASVFAWKLDADGNLAWARRLGGASRDWGADLALRSDGSIEVTGQFRGVADFDPRRGVLALDAGDSWDVFLVTPTSGGNLAATPGTLGSRRGTVLQRFGLWIDRADNLLLTGGFGATIDFDPGPAQLLADSAGSTDIFLLKLRPQP